jgi:hypothetical protein
MNEEKESHVMIPGGDWIPLSSVEFLNVEEDIMGADVITFKYEGQTLKSHCTMRYNTNKPYNEEE